MKRAIVSIGILLLMLTGCSNNKETFLPYETVSGGSADILYNNDSIPLFSENLCVIDEEEFNFHDKVMTSSGSLLVNQTTNETIYADNVFDKLYPASITKLITALLVYEYGNLDEIVTISKNASNITEAGAKLCGFKENDQISLETLLNCLLVYSGNDAGIAIAEHIAGSESAFNDMINDRLEHIGATQTHFTNAHGLHDENHYTSAYDIYLMFHELLKYDEFKQVIKQVSYTAIYKSTNGQEKQVVFDNTNMYLLGSKQSPEGVTVLGGKTGTTNKAGYCLILLSSDQIGNDYISIVLNAKGKTDLYNQMNYLLSKINSH